MPEVWEMVCPIKVVATNEKGFLTDLAKVDMGGGAFLPATEETLPAGARLQGTDRLLSEMRKGDAFKTIATLGRNRSNKERIPVFDRLFSLRE